MRKLLALIITVLAGLAAYAYFAGVAEAPHDGSEAAEAHVREHISALSPEPAVLGGTFYVTTIEAADGRGTVWYEDGHIALVADFTYVEDKYGVSVTSFEVRNQNR